MDNVKTEGVSLKFSRGDCILMYFRGITDESLVDIESSGESEWETTLIKKLVKKGNQNRRSPVNVTDFYYKNSDLSPNS